MESTANIRGSDYLRPVSQGRKMEQAGGDSYRIHLPHQGANPFFIPKDIGEIGEFTPHIVVGDAQVIPIFMPSGEWYYAKKKYKLNVDFFAKSTESDFAVFRNHVF